jgi:PLP dependent protein
MTTSTVIADNIKRVQDQIADACARAKRDPAEVTLVAVSKRKPVSAIQAALAAGVQHFGENRVEEASEKIPQVRADAPQPIWHMVGHIQSRKAKQVVPLFNVVQSVDSLKLAKKLSSLAQEQHLLLDALLEVNTSGEAEKYGFAAHNWQADAEVRATLWDEMREVLALPNLNVRGLMTMAPFYEDMQATRPTFVGLAELRAALYADFSADLPELSMGMTNDYPVAIEEGATLIRIGRAIFGERD